MDIKPPLTPKELENNRQNDRQKTAIKLVRTDFDYNADLEEMMIEEEQKKILYTTLLISLLIFLLNLYAW